MNEEPIIIAGAGPAGLAAAITLATNGKEVIVHEAQPFVGARFDGDLQGLENWSRKVDILEQLATLGLSVDFRRHPAIFGLGFDAWRTEYIVSSKTPLFYTIERGPGEGSFDTALLNQAESLGVEVKFNSRLKNIPGPGILATGPKRADAIAVGYHFRTNAANGFWFVCDDELAPGGYSYVLVLDGIGTVKSCMFRDFKNEKVYVERTVTAFERLVGLEMRDRVPHAGFGNFTLRGSEQSGKHPIAGEQAGFQDTLWGFGIRYAVMSGVLAARSLLKNLDYDSLWKREFRSSIEVSVVNRAFYSMLGNRGYRWALRKLARGDNLHEHLSEIYRPSKLKRLLLPIANIRFKSLRDDETCCHENCECVFCRHCEESRT
ncbi:MAG: FAD-binding protein [Aridibacter famidurans]|nr:FAD-binding protein [Aridibacter famidurans]